jgi:hypothetical protein
MALVRKVITGELDKRVKHLESAMLEKAALTNSAATALSDVFAVADGLGNRQKLIESMASPVIDATQAMGLKEPERLTKALAPVIFIAIAAGVSLALADIRRSFKSTSPIQRLMWKLESKRTGVAVEHLVSRDLYPYSIVAAWVFEADTGALLAYARQDESLSTTPNTHTTKPKIQTAHTPPETTSALLASIRMFAQEHGLLNTPNDVQLYESGRQKIWLRAQDRRVVAVQVDGEPAGWENRFRAKAASILALAHPQAVQDSVSDWVLQCSPQAVDSKKGRVFGVLCVLALAALMLQRSYMGYTAYSIEQHLNAQTGVVSCEVDSGWTRWRVRTVADPAVPVLSSLETARIATASRIDWANTPIWSPEPALVLLRLNALKRQFPALSFRDGLDARAPSTLVISGTVDASTQQALLAALKQTPSWLLGAAQYDTSSLSVMPSSTPSPAPAVQPLAVHAVP